MKGLHCPGCSELIDPGSPPPAGWHRRTLRCTHCGGAARWTPTWRWRLVLAWAVLGGLSAAIAPFVWSQAAAGTLSAWWVALWFVGFVVTGVAVTRAIPSWRLRWGRLEASPGR